MREFGDGETGAVDADGVAELGVGEESRVGGGGDGQGGAGATGGRGVEGEEGCHGCGNW